MCGDFRIKTQDNSVILCGHSMQFPISQTSEVIVFNRGEKFESHAPDGTKGAAWESKYGFTGINAFHINAPDTGMNEVGLSFSTLVLEATKYPDVPKDEYSLALAMTDVSNYILSRCATIKEVKEELANVRIYGQFIPQMNRIPGLHIALHDAEGNDAVIEFIDGKIEFYDNPNGVLTNDPPLPEQLKQLEKYEKLDPINGMKGIPGSWMADDRFARLSLEVQKAPTTNCNDALDNVVKILNATDLPNGVETCEFLSQTFTITTLWQSIMNLKEKVFYFRPHGDPTFRFIDLKLLNLNPGTKHEKIPVHTNKMTLIDITQQLNPASMYNYMKYGKNPTTPIISELVYPAPSTLLTEKTKQVVNDVFEKENQQKLSQEREVEELKVEKIAQ